MINNENKLRHIKEVDCITLDKNAFEDVKEMLGNELSDTCKYCGTKITKDTFGLIFRGITSCKDFICLMNAYEEIEKQNKELIINKTKKSN